MINPPQHIRRFIPLGIAIVAAAGLAALMFAGPLFEGIKQQGGDKSPFTKLVISQAAAKENFDLKPSKEDSLGVKPESSFTLTSKVAVSLESIKDHLRVEPTTDIAVEKIDDKTFSITPQKPLAVNTVYRVSLAAETMQDGQTAERTYSWAYQITNPFRALSTLPRNRATNVAPDTGIEITFSHEQFAGWEPFIEFDPKVDGRFEKHKRTLVFVPKKLQNNTVYTVNIKKGLPLSGTSETLGEGITFQFETGGDADRRGDYTSFGFSRDFSEVTPEEAPVLGVFSYNLPSDDLQITAYRFKDFDEFQSSFQKKTEIPGWAYNARQRFTVDASKLVRAVEFRGKVEESNGTNFIRFPDKLSAGPYLVETTVKNQKYQSWVLVTPIASYLSVSRTKTLIWLNDVVTKQPIAEADVRLVGLDAAAKTDQKGVAFFDTPDILQKGKTALFRVQKGGDESVIPAIQYDYSYNYDSPWAVPKNADLYWRYAYTDRELYLPSDTARFWGIVKSRENPAGKLDLTIQLQKDSFYDYYYNPVVLGETRVSTNDLGTFQGEMPLKNLQPGYYQIMVKNGNDIVTSRGFEVQTYAKPAYKIEITPRKRAIFAGESAQFRVQTEFFEGTPVPNLELKLSESGKESVAQTDDQGRIEKDIPTAYEAPQSGYGSNYPRTVNVYAAPSKSEEGEISGEGAVQVFGAKIALETVETSQAETEAKFSVKTRRIDLSKINNTDEANSYDYLGDAAPNQTVKGKIIEMTYETKETGEYYDFISKVVRKKYEYTQNTKTIKEFAGQTNGTGIYSLNFSMVKDRSYSVELEAVDSDGRKDVRSLWFYGSANYGNWGSNRFNLDSGDQNLRYSIGDSVELAFKRGAELLPKGIGNAYLFTKARSGIMTYDLQDDPVYQFSFSNEHIPNIMVAGVWFNGQTYQQSDREEYFFYGGGGGGSGMARFRSEDRKLIVKVQANKESYKPGEDVRLTVMMTDKDGKPQSGETNLNIVDEAFYALLPYSSTVDPLSALYQVVSSGILTTYASHQTPTAETGAERGGGGGDRKDFQDTALFQSVRTGKDGKGEIRFTLPDNVTSWRVTAQGVTGDLEAGAGIFRIPVSLPFFVEGVINAEQRAGDKPILSVRAFGSGLQAGDDVDFTVSIPGIGMEEKKLKGKAFEPMDVPLPPLPEGVFEMKLHGQKGKLSDTIIKPLRVLGSRLTKQEVQFGVLSETSLPDSSKSGRTTLMFFDKNRGQLYQELQRASWTWGDRLDQRLARHRSQLLLRDSFEEKTIEAEPLPGSTYQTDSGGLSLLPYSGAELPLSATAAAVDSVPFDAFALKKYFYGVLDDRSSGAEQIAYALWGLASLDEPVLTLIRRAADLPGIGDEEKILLALSAARLGDTDGLARDVYQDVLKKFGETQKPYIRIALGKDQDDVLTNTVRMAVLAAILGEKEGEDMREYVADHQWEVRDIVLDLEKILYIQTRIPKLSPESVKFTYAIAGESKSVELEKGKRLTLDLSPEDFSTLRFSRIEGSVGVVSLFQAPIDVSKETDNRVSVRREYYAGGKKTQTLKESDLVQVRVYPKVSAQVFDYSYQVTDIVPSGLKVLTRPYRRGDTWGDCHQYYPYEVSGQKISFLVGQSISSVWCPGDYFTYWARVVSKGDFSAEPVLIQGFKVRGVYNLSQESQVISIR